MTKGGLWARGGFVSDPYVVVERVDLAALELEALHRRVQRGAQTGTHLSDLDLLHLRRHNGVEVGVVPQPPDLGDYPLVHRVALPIRDDEGGRQHLLPGRAETGGDVLFCF